MASNLHLLCGNLPVMALGPAACMLIRTDCSARPFPDPRPAACLQLTLEVIETEKHSVRETVYCQPARLLINLQTPSIVLPLIFAYHFDCCGMGGANPCLETGPPILIGSGLSTVVLVACDIRLPVSPVVEVHLLTRPRSPVTPYYYFHSLVFYPPQAPLRSSLTHTWCTGLYLSGFIPERPAAALTGAAPDGRRPLLLAGQEEALQSSRFPSPYLHLFCPRRSTSTG
ncbi:hypothetical protein BDW66DRAFT_21646 [Aspergillus desertorum]